MGALSGLEERSGAMDVVPGCTDWGARGILDRLPDCGYSKNVPPMRASAPGGAVR